MHHTGRAKLSCLALSSRPLLRAGGIALGLVAAPLALLAAPGAAVAAMAPGAAVAAAVPGAAAAAERPQSTGPWRWPVAAPIIVVRRFAPPPEPWLPGHRGVDLAAAPGATVRAAGAGRVSFAGPLAGRGVVVVVHGVLRTTYEPVVATVAVGDVVPAGGPIGRLSPGGHCPSACLHWGLRRGEVYLDPLLLVRPRKVRLLPVWAAGDAGGERPRSVAGVVTRPAATTVAPVAAGDPSGVHGSASDGSGSLAAAAAAIAVTAAAGVATAPWWGRAGDRPP
jgi:murein DD-endopeptidase MepM/ murein hydrolase activator NlpD